MWNLLKWNDFKAFLFVALTTFHWRSYLLIMPALMSFVIPKNSHLQLSPIFLNSLTKSANQQQSSIFHHKSHRLASINMSIYMSIKSICVCICPFSHHKQHFIVRCRHLTVPCPLWNNKTLLSNPITSFGSADIWAKEYGFGYCTYRRAHRHICSCVSTNVCVIFLALLTCKAWRAICRPLRALVALVAIELRGSDILTFSCWWMSRISNHINCH